MGTIANRRIAVLATDGFEQVELTEPVKALKAAGAEVVIIAPQSGQIQGMNHHEKGDKIAVDHDLGSVSPERFDALVLPGGVANPDTLRINPQAVAFVPRALDADRGGRRARPSYDVLAFTAHRSDKCRGDLGGQIGCCERAAGDVPQAGRSARLLP